MSLEAVLKQSLGYAAVRSVGRRGYGDTASGSAFEVTDGAGKKERIFDMLTELKKVTTDVLFLCICLCCRSFYSAKPVDIRQQMSKGKVHIPEITE